MVRMVSIARPESKDSSCQAIICCFSSKKFPLISLRTKLGGITQALWQQQPWMKNAFAQFKKARHLPNSLSLLFKIVRYKSLLFLNFDCDRNSDNMLTKFEVSSSLKYFKFLYPAIDDFLRKSIKLETKMKAALFEYSECIDSFQKIACRTSNSKGRTLNEVTLEIHASVLGVNDNVGSFLISILDRQRLMESQIRGFTK